jgi:hypothetical protein
MIVYNVSMKVDPEIENDWVQWQQQEHIPAIMASRQFSDYKFYRLLDEETDDTATYVLQFFSPSIENYQYYISNFASQLSEQALAKWGNLFIAFRSVMRVVE